MDLRYYCDSLRISKSDDSKMTSKAEIKSANNQNQEMGQVDISIIKAALKLDYEQLCNTLDAKDIMISLLSGDVLSHEEFQHIEQEGQNRGSIAQTRLLLSYIMNRPEQEKLNKFLTILMAKQEEVHFNLQKTICSLAIKYEGLKEHLVEVYHGWQYNKIYVLPGEKFKLNLNSTHKVMPMDFSVEMIQNQQKLQEVLDTECITLRYIPVAFNSLEEVISALQNRTENRSILCTALAGSGKTIFVHSLINQWMKESDLLKCYKGMFAIAVRDIDVKAPLMEILGTGRNGLGLIDDSMKASITSCLITPESASKIIFVIDGVDEKTIPEETELYRLLTGKLYPHCKVFMTSRPEAPILNCLVKIPHAYKVKIKGTTKVGVFQYLKTTIIEDENQNTKNVCDEQLKQKEVEDLVQQCQQSKVQFNLLKVPLYLTLIGHIFNTHWAEYLTFQHLSIPDTSTKLFNGFLLILLREWLKVISRQEEAHKLIFKNNPVDRSSNVPTDIKAKLIGFGKMSYELSNKQIFTFTKADLDEYLVDINDVKQSGLFCLSMQDDQVTGFYRHREMQDYMSALFLSHEKMNYAPFCDMIRFAASNQRKSSLTDILGRVQSAMPFLFGLNPDFAVTLLGKLNNHFRESKLHLQENNLDYLALLCHESSDSKVQESVREVLLHYTGNSSYRSELYTQPSSMLQSLFAGFSTDQRITLLHNRYNLHVHREGDTWIIGNIHYHAWGLGNKKQIQYSKKLTIAHLDYSLYFLLLPFQFPYIHNLHVKESFILNVQLIQRVFTHVNHLHLEDFYISDNTMSSDNNNTSDNSLTELIMVGHYDSVLPRSSMGSLLQQPHLRSLSVKWVNILLNVQDVKCDIMWSNLTRLEISLFKIVDCSKDKTYDNLIWLMQYTPKLQELTLGCCHNKTTKFPGDFIQQLSHCISIHLPQLNRLALYNVIKSLRFEDLCLQLQSLSQISTLGLGWEDVDEREHELAHAMNSSFTHITLIQIIHNGYPDVNNVCKRLKKALKSTSAIHVKVQSVKLDMYTC